MKNKTTYGIRPCQACGRTTQHHISHCFTDAGVHTGNVIRCRECPPDEVTAWLMSSGLLKHVVVTDDQDITIANRPLEYGHGSADLALTALGFSRVTEWETGPDADTCLVRWR